MYKRLLSLVWVAALLPAAIVSVRAHAVPPEVIAYLKGEGGSLRVLVRIPAAFLTEARLPVRTDGYLDLQTADASLAAVAADVARNLDVMQDGRPLPAPQAAWTISRAPDRSFDTYERAVARVDAPGPPVETAVDPSAALVDLRLDYAIQSAAARFSVRVNGFRAANSPSQMRTIYVTPSGRIRTFVASGTPRHVALEPRRQAVASMFARLGTEQLAQSVVHLLFVLCLAIPVRSTRAALTAFGMFVAAFFAAMAFSAILPGTGDLSRVRMFQALAGGALVVAALQNITLPRSVWMQATAAAFGLLDGLVFGVFYRQNVPLAGSHPIVSLVSFTVPVVIGSLWLLMVARPVVGLVCRVMPDSTGFASLLNSGVERTRKGSGLRTSWTVILLSAIPIHAGLHAVLGAR